jgi:hypothetical protein
MTCSVWRLRSGGGDIRIGSNDKSRRVRKNRSNVYRRPSRFLAQEGTELDVKSLTDRGCSLTEISALDGKFLAWDNEALAITSFNRLSTVVDVTRTRGAEIGILPLGQNLREIIASKLKAPSKGALEI